jgi:hypothetical protein
VRGEDEEMEMQRQIRKKNERYRYNKRERERERGEGGGRGRGGGGPRAAPDDGEEVVEVDPARRYLPQQQRATAGARVERHQIQNVLSTILELSHHDGGCEPVHTRQVHFLQKTEQHA